MTSSKRNADAEKDRQKIVAYKASVKEEQHRQAQVVSEMKGRLPTIPYSGSVTKWRKKAIAVGYPRCQECTMPISRSHWDHSITMCPTCKGLLGGYLSYKTMDDEVPA